jgi:hypothetical protein
MVPPLKTQRVQGEGQKPGEETGSESNHEIDLYPFYETGGGNFFREFTKQTVYR